MPVPVPAVPVFALGASDCEALHAGWLGQPVNAWSSLAYLAAGAYLLARDGPVAPAVALGAVGLGSFLYHGPMPPGAEAVHDGAIVVLGLTIVVAARRHREAGRPERPPSRGPGKRGLSMPRGLPGGFLPRGLPVPPWTAGLALAGAVVANLLGRTGAPWCRPDSLLQAHAAWHVLTAGAAAAWLARWRAPRFL